MFVTKAERKAMINRDHRLRVEGQAEGTEIVNTDQGGQFIERFWRPHMSLADQTPDTVYFKDLGVAA